jgi:hypothetical protein
MSEIRSRQKPARRKLYLFTTLLLTFAFGLPSLAGIAIGLVALANDETAQDWRGALIFIAAGSFGLYIVGVAWYEFYLTIKSRFLNRKRGHDASEPK